MLARLMRLRFATSIIIGLLFSQLSGGPQGWWFCNLTVTLMWLWEEARTAFSCPQVAITPYVVFKSPLRWIGRGKCWSLITDSMPATAPEHVSKNKEIHLSKHSLIAGSVVVYTHYPVCS